MRRTKRFASFALAACMGVSLLVNVPAEMVSAAEPASVAATATDAESGVSEEVTEETSLEQAEEVVAAGAETSEADFEWSGTKITKYIGKGGDVVIPSKSTAIGEWAFSGCSSLTSITIPKSVTKIDDCAFDGCRGLTSLTIPEGVTTIGISAFEACRGLTSVIIPKSVTTIGVSAFHECGNLADIKVAAGNSVYDSRDNCNGIVEKKTNTLIRGCKNTIIPNSVTTIGGYAFTGCSSLTSLTIPGSVTEIEAGTFSGCSGLADIKVAAGNSVYDSRDNCNGIVEKKTNTLIAGCKNTIIPNSVTTIEEYAFFGCYDLTSITIPEGVSYIGDYAFGGCSGLTSITILEGVTDIGNCAFFACKNLTSITIPESVTSIASTAFEYSGLKTIRGYAGSYAETYAKKNGFAFEAITGPTPGVTKDVTTSYRTHVQSFGWQASVTNGKMSGTSGKAKRLEGIEISVSGNANLGIQYSTHCQTYGWLPWSANGEMNGTTGEAKRLEAIKIRLTGKDKDKYDVYYRVHAQSYGWLGWAKNGAPSGTAGYAKRLEGIQIVVVKKGAQAPGLDYAGVNASKGVKDARAYVAKTNGAITIPGSADNVNIMYKTHVQSFGWQNWVLNGAMSGTSGKAKRLEGIDIKLSNAPYAGGIQYKTHIQSFGWEKQWKKDGEMSGTSGKAKRLEAIQIQLYGEMAKHYDVYYRVHAQSYGWLNWAKNGEEAGTAGLAKRLEGIQIVLVPKGSAAPSANYGNIKSVNTKAYIKK